MRKINSQERNGEAKSEDLPKNVAIYSSNGVTKPMSVWVSIAMGLVCSVAGAASIYFCTKTQGSSVIIPAAFLGILLLAGIIQIFRGIKGLIKSYL